MMLTRDEVVTVLAARGITVTAAQWSSMVSRSLAPAPDERVSRTPLWDEATIAGWQPIGRGVRSDTRRTWDLVEEAGIKPHRCEKCGSTTESFTTYVDDAQMKGRESWSWQCGGCGGLSTLTRATIVRRWRKWRDEQ